MKAGTSRYQRKKRLCPKLPPERYPELREIVLAQPDATLPEHAARLAIQTGIDLSPSHLSRLLGRLDLPLKKSP